MIEQLVLVVQTIEYLIEFTRLGLELLGCVLFVTVCGLMFLDQLQRILRGNK